MSHFEIKRIVLPGGKVVELIYFQLGAQAQPEPEPVPAAAGPDRSLETCPSCTGRLVCPVDWREVEDERWELELRCPDCDWRSREVFAQEDVDRYDDALCAATDELVDEIERLRREIMEEEIERFVKALDEDLILPFDF
jgi:hypothetical protein